MINFHTILQENYLEVHRWLLQLTDVRDYRRKNAWNRVNKILKDDTWESAVLQYYVLFPTHAAKVVWVFEEILGLDRILDWLKYNPQVTVIDIGCGSGAASIAFINALLSICEGGSLNNPIEVHILGIDLGLHAVIIYSQQLKRLKDKVAEYGIILSYKVMNSSDLQAVNWLKDELALQREAWNIPFLPHVFLLQSNIVSPLSERFRQTQWSRETLVAFDVPLEVLGNIQEVFGKEEATAYKQIFENASIDNLHIVTVGTEGYERRVSELASAIDNEFQGNNHAIRRMGGGEYSITFQNLEGSFWRDQKNEELGAVNFCLEISSISNVTLADHDWKEISSIPNLLSAWARARHHLLVDQTLVDEVEIRLFESKLDANITRLQQQLVAYAQDVVRSDDRLHFKFPKGNDKIRPLGLSRIEEEILSTALIQKLGERISGIVSRSYAYKFSRSYGNQHTEYLYESWLTAYSRYLKEAKQAAERTKGCTIIQADITSFYTRIIRDTLVQLSTEQLGRSVRVEWLLKLLFARDIDGIEAGHGIVQGNIGSGFFANLYLVDLDARFGATNEWNVDFFRYVDDMIIIVPEPEHVDEVLTVLEKELKNLGLELNSEKTERFTDVEEFLNATNKDDIFDELQNQFQNWINCLWILNDQHRQAFRKAYSGSSDEWWYRVDIYQMCLKSINIYIEPTQLSRFIYKYLFNSKLCQKDYTWEQFFELPSFPEFGSDDEIDRWKNKFQDKNTIWLAEGESIANRFQELLRKATEEISRATESQDGRSEKNWTSILRFCVNKLIQIGLENRDVAQAVVEILINKPWLVRKPQKLTENLAIFGYRVHIELLLAHYSDETDELKEYMKAIILRSIRFLPNITIDLWQQVVKSSISNSDVTSLMATETWLKVVQKQPELVQDSDLTNIETILNRQPRPKSRLLKNYLLIMGIHGEKSPVDNVANQNTMIVDAINVAQEENIDALFDYHEPDIILREFYSGYRYERDYELPY